MAESEYNYFNYSIEEEYFDTGEKQEGNFYNENRSEEQKVCSSTGEGNNSNNQSEKKDNSDNHLTNGGNDIYNNIEENINDAKTSANKISNGDNLDIFQYNNKNEFNQNKAISNENISTINGNQILTSNPIINNKMQELFDSTEINYDNLQNMQMLKKKKRRRKKEEILKERSEKITVEIEGKKKSIGRLKKKLIGKVLINHSKDADDNIIKKINATLLDSVRIWLNNSFLDEDSVQTHFQSQLSRKKKKKLLFAKLCPKLITNKVKKGFILKMINTKFKDIFSKFEISPKYKNISNFNNKELIDNIYKENEQNMQNKQPFVIYILELKFIDALNYFSGQISDEKIKSFFAGKFSEELINQFISKFNKIEKFLDDLYKTLSEDGNSKEEIKDYLDKIIVLCLNYKQSFEKKYERSENKNKKNKNDEQQ